MSVVPASVRQRIIKLRKEIEHHRYLTHVLDRQEISEAALDSLKHELFQLEQEYPSLVTSDSPTQRVAGQPAKGLKKVEHSSRMLSLEDVFSFEELRNWDARWKKAVPDGATSYLVDLKLDGLAMSLVYRQGVLFRAATRGDGHEGEDVTHTVKTIESIPLRLQSEDFPSTIKKVINESEVEIRGEVVMLKKDFDQLNARQKKMGLPEFANPRNVSAGSIRQLDPALAAERRLTFFSWELVTDLGQPTIKDSYEVMKRLGLKVNPLAQVCETLDEIQHFHSKVLRQRQTLDFWIDGVVVKINDRELYRKLGVVGKAPRGATAYKFPAEQVTTVVEDIQVQVGRTGALTPVAHLRPVQVAGTTVSRATLHNADEISRLDVRVGDTVILQKAGDIIPDVVQVLVNLRPRSTKPFVMPSRCPVCHRPTTRHDGEVAVYCSNTNCPARHREMLYHFTSKKGLDIEGLGPSTVDVLVDEGLVSSPDDFYKLRPDQLVGLPLFAEKKSIKLIENIQASKKVRLDRFIFSLGIRHVGEQTAIDLALHFGSIENLMKATVEEFAAIPNIGTVVAKSIAQYFSDHSSASMVRRLSRAVTIQPIVRTTKSVLSGKIFVVTGTLETMSREEAHEKIRSAGGTVATSVGPKTNYLIVGDKPGSKVSAAEKYGVTILTEQAFRRMLE